jgi:hypothetical protein
MYVVALRAPERPERPLYFTKKIQNYLKVKIQNSGRLTKVHGYSITYLIIMRIETLDL